ncbi:MAG: hypothetical protein HQL95_06605 [Magnetococcales bacterium]|nr:hypothetical protein [Magnetococcales bacterium]
MKGDFDISISDGDMMTGYEHLIASIPANPTDENPVTNGNSKPVKHLLNKHGSLVGSMNKSDNDTPDIDDMILKILFRKGTA